MLLKTFTESLKIWSRKTYELINEVFIFPSIKKYFIHSFIYMYYVATSRYACIVKAPLKQLAPQ